MNSLKFRVHRIRLNEENVSDKYRGYMLITDPTVSAGPILITCFILWPQVKISAVANPTALVIIILLEAGNSSRTDFDRY